jgi:hypothetical protein
MHRGGYNYSQKSGTEFAAGWCSAVQCSAVQCSAVQCIGEEIHARGAEYGNQLNRPQNNIFNRLTITCSASLSQARPAFCCPTLPFPVLACHSAVQCSGIVVARSVYRRHSSVCQALKCGESEGLAVQCSAVQCSAVQCSAVWGSVVQ